MKVEVNISYFYVSEAPFIVELKVHCIDELGRHSENCEIVKYSDDHEPKQISSDMQIHNYTIPQGYKILDFFFVRPLPDKMLKEIKIEVFAIHRTPPDEEGAHLEYQGECADTVRFD